MVLGIQLISLFSVGGYRGVWRYFGLMDGVTFAKGVGLGTLVSVSLITYIYRFEDYSRGVFVIYAALLMLAVVGITRVVPPDQRVRASPQPERCSGGDLRGGRRRRECRARDAEPSIGRLSDARLHRGGSGDGACADAGVSGDRQLPEAAPPHRGEGRGPGRPHAVDRRPAARASSANSAPNGRYRSNACTSNSIDWSRHPELSAPLPRAAFRLPCALNAITRTNPARSCRLRRQAASGGSEASATSMRGHGQPPSWRRESHSTCRRSDGTRLMASVLAPRVDTPTGMHDRTGRNVAS